MRSRLLLVSGLLVSGLGTVAAAQSAEYTVTRIQPPPNAYSAVPTGFNALGHVVGWSQFFDGSPALQAWVWTPETGIVYLPQPPGLTGWRAIDLNDADVITGDGGYDSGVAWRYQDGLYEILGFLPGDNASTASAVNALGVVAATSRDAGSFLVPPNAVLAVPGQPLQLVLADAWATCLNDAGQVVGYSSNQAWRYTPGIGVEFLGPLGTRTLTWAWSINAHGDVVGAAAQANGNGQVPFLYTDAGGIEEIGNFGGGAIANDLDDAGTVVGDFQTSLNQPWIWNRTDGVRFLGTLIDPSENLTLINALRINGSGQVLCFAFDNTVADFRPVVLTPIEPPPGGLGTGGRRSVPPPKVGSRAPR